MEASSDESVASRLSGERNEGQGNVSSLSAETFAARIIGGQEVPRFSIKHQASLQTSRGHDCGGT